MILYADSSSILSLHLREQGRHPVTVAAYDAADRVVCSAITLPEVRAGLARARFVHNPPKLTQGQYERAVSDFEADWESYGRVSATQRLMRRAATLAERHRLRGFDAVHLAAALEVDAALFGELALATWDSELGAAAEAEGLSLAHEVTT